jgi:hypothetical protein
VSAHKLTIALDLQTTINKSIGKSLSSALGADWPNNHLPQNSNSMLGTREKGKWREKLTNNLASVY